MRAIPNCTYCTAPPLSFGAVCDEINVLQPHATNTSRTKHFKFEGYLVFSGTSNATISTELGYFQLRPRLVGGRIIVTRGKVVFPTPPWSKMSLYTALRPKYRSFPTLIFPISRNSSSTSRWKLRQQGDSAARDAKLRGLKSRAAFKLLEVSRLVYVRLLLGK